MKSRAVKKYKATTNSEHNLPVHENMLDRQFQVQAPSQAWVTDITYVATDEGWLYLASVMDLYSRKLWASIWKIGWQKNSLSRRWI